MSQRVQKGSTVFRPVARPRAHAATGSESRQTSAVPDSRPPAGPSSVQHDSSSKDTSSMAPPASIPAKPPPIATESLEVARNPPSVGSVASGSNQENARPVVANGPTVIVPPSRDRSRPPTVQIAIPSRLPSSTPLRQVAPPTSQPTLAAVEYTIDNAIAVAALTQLAAAMEVPPETQVAAEPASSTRPKRKRQPRKSSGDTHENGVEVSSGAAPKRRKDKSTAPRKPRARPPSVPPFDPDDPGEELDPTVITMATLCDDTGQGRVSSKAVQIVTNHAAWRATNREKRARMRAQMEAKKYGWDTEEDQPNPKKDDSGQLDQDESSLPSTFVEQPVAQPSSSGTGFPGQSASADAFDYAENLATTRYAVQVRIGPNGETIIDETSLFVNRNEEHDTEEYTHIEESDTTKFVNSSTYSKKLRGSRWSAEETELFYDALSQFGENYELISYVLPGRDRKACRNKFKAEDKKNPNRITYCLNNRKPYDIQTLSRMTGKDFSGPTPVIKAPTPVRLDDQDGDGGGGQDVPGPNKRDVSDDKSGDNEEEILGNVDSDEELPDSLFSK